MNRRKCFIGWMLALTLLCATAAAETRIMVVSDIHHLATTAYEKDNPYFEQVAEKSVGKMVRESEALLKALVAEVRHQQPDLLLITGDLTFNGERASHEQLRDALAATGVETVVLPGNHDINNVNAVRFTADGIERIESPTSAEFAEIWRGMRAEAYRGPGFSGVKKVNDGVWLALGDYSVYEDRNEEHGMATEAHAQWMAEVLDAAQREGATLISATHQTMRKHTEYSAHTFRVNKNADILTALEDAGCRLNLCGHMHIQHILDRPDGMSEAATGAWCIYPHCYGIVTVGDDGRISYRAARACDEHLPEGFAEASREFFRSTFAKGVRIELTMNGIFDQQQMDMQLYATDVNEGYFSGTLAEQPELLTDPAREMWRAIRKGSTFAQYLTTVMDEEISDALTWVSR